MKRLFLAALVLAFGFGALSPVRANALVLEKNGHLDFTRKDNLALPTYNWPRTLLCYPVDFEGGIRSAAELTLIDNRHLSPRSFPIGSGGEVRRTDCDGGSSFLRVASLRRRLLLYVEA